MSCWDTPIKLLSVPIAHRPRLPGNSSLTTAEISMFILAWGYRAQVNVTLTRWQWGKVLHVRSHSTGSEKVNDTWPWRWQQAAFVLEQQLCWDRFAMPLGEIFQNVLLPPTNTVKATLLFLFLFFQAKCHFKIKCNIFDCFWHGFKFSIEFLCHRMTFREQLEHPLKECPRDTWKIDCNGRTINHSG